jgi:protein-tyrosine sulfotransferase
VELGAPTFIMSDVRSGSTLLRYCLDSHPSICCPSEIRLGMVSQVLLQMADLLRPTDTASVLDSAAIRDEEYALVRSTLDAYMADYCRRRGKTTWCDKSPTNADYMAWLLSVFPDGRFICLYRGALDVVRSMIGLYGPKPSHLSAFLEKNGGDSVAAHLERWCRTTERLLAFEQAYPGQTIRMTYERLVARPQLELARVTSFLGLEAVPDLAIRAFSTSHDFGPGDPQIRMTTSIRTDRVGRGASLDTRKVPFRTLQRMELLMTLVDSTDETARQAPK